MKRTFSIAVLSFLIITYSLFTPLCVSAQCAMCKAVAKSNVESGQNRVGLGVNKGVLYLLSVPYLLAGVGVLIWYRHKKSVAANGN